MGEVWTPENSEKLKTHFDLCNSTHTLKSFIGEDIKIYDFKGNISTCILKRVSWDNFKIEFPSLGEITIHLTQEGRKIYPVSLITTLNGSIIYQHQEPNNGCVHGKLNLQEIILEQQLYLDIILSHLGENT